MTINAFIQVSVYLLVLLILVKPLGLYMSRVYEGKSCFGVEKFLGPIERFFYKLCGIKADKEMTWKSYLSAIIIFNLLGFFLVYAVQRLQFYLPLNPQHFTAPSADSALNTAISFISNTNWQSYSGETSMSYLTQMLVLGTQNFLSAATGMSVLVALIRGISRRESGSLGNFWVDLTRGTLYILLPLSILWATLLMSQGVIQNFHSTQTVNVLQPSSYVQTTNDAQGRSVNQSISITQQSLPQGPVASQVAIKQLGTNGGGYFNANSAHPYENPTPISNFLEMLAILLIPAALCYTFGCMVGDTKQGWAILIAMLIIFIPFMLIGISAEHAGNPAFTHMGIAGGNMEGKETRFGITDSSIWASATSAASNGSTNASMDSLTPIGGLVSMWLMQLGEIIFGGAGSGLYGMLIMVILTVFVAGLMVGRTPEYLGKKIEPFEMKMASVALLVMPCTVLLMTAIGVSTQIGRSVLGNPGAHGFSEILYAFTSMVNNNGSAFAGLSADIPFYNVLGSLAMLIGRYWIIIPVLVIAGSLAKKKITPPSSGTLPTDTVFFVGLLVVIIMIVGALTFLPSLALGPIVEQLMMLGK
ncbi:MAG: kdpA [Gammaproteobacteria bacterium]|nr:kdpA [Gammaproteobacteria bacterium]